MCSHDFICLSRHRFKHFSVTRKLVCSFWIGTPSNEHWNHQLIQTVSSYFDNDHSHTLTQQRQTAATTQSMHPESFGSEETIHCIIQCWDNKTSQTLSNVYTERAAAIAATVKTTPSALHASSSHFYSTALSIYIIRYDWRHVWSTRHTSTSRLLHTLRISMLLLHLLDCMRPGRPLIEATVAYPRQISAFNLFSENHSTVQCSHIP